MITYEDYTENLRMCDEYWKGDKNPMCDLLLTWEDMTDYDWYFEELRGDEEFPDPKIWRANSRDGDWCIDVMRNDDAPGLWEWEVMYNDCYGVWRDTLDDYKKEPHASGVTPSLEQSQRTAVAAFLVLRESIMGFYPKEAV